MARGSLVLSVLIASPSDVGKERDVVAQVIHDWNAVNSRRMGISLEPIRWETHTFPASGARPQEIIDKQIVDDCDFVIGIFGVRLGTPTGESQSGTIEEIERLRKQGKHVSLYFSSAPVPRDTDRQQLEALQKYQDARSKDTLYRTFATPEDLQHQVSRHLPQVVANVHEKLRNSGGLETAERELTESQAVAAQQLVRLASAAGAPVIDGGTFGPPLTQVGGPFQLKVEAEKQFPEGPTLRVVGNRDFKLNQIDYLDEHNVKLFSQPVGLAGQNLEVPIDSRELTKVWNRTRQSYHVKFRLNMLVDGRPILHMHPAFVEQQAKDVNGTLTFYMHLLG
jgi:Domain of unknown function (DUF4062)